MGIKYLSKNLKRRGTSLDLDMMRASVKINRKGMKYRFLHFNSIM
jgi:hypothetical protein